MTIFDSAKSTELSSTIPGARVDAFRRRFTFLSPGFHERDPLRIVVAGIPRFTFTSRAMATSLIKTNRDETLVNRVPYEDFALVKIDTPGGQHGSRHKSEVLNYL